MIHPEKLTRQAPYFDYQRLSETCRKLEQEYGLAVDNGFDKARDNRLSQKAATLEAKSPVVRQLCVGRPNRIRLATCRL